MTQVAPFFSAASFSPMTFIPPLFFFYGNFFAEEYHFTREERGPLLASSLSDEESTAENNATSMKVSARERERASERSPYS